MKICGAEKKPVFVFRGASPKIISLSSKINDHQGPAPPRPHEVNARSLLILHNILFTLAHKNIHTSHCMVGAKKDGSAQA